MPDYMLNIGNIVSMPSDNDDPAPREGLQSDTIPQSTVVEKPTALPAVTWSDYLKFATSVSPGLRSSDSDAISPSSSKLGEPAIHSDIEVVLPSSSKTSSGSWLTPWTWWWYSNSESHLTTEPILVPVPPKMDLQSSQGNTEATHVSLDTNNSIGTSPKTRAGWLSILASTSALRRAVKEQGECMEVMVVEEELPNNSQPAALNGKNNQPDSRLNVADQISESASLKKRDSSAAPSTVSVTSQLTNYLILPTFEDTFSTPPRSNPLPKESSTLHRTVNYVAKMLFNDESKEKEKRKGKEPFGQELPKVWNVLGEDLDKELGRIKRVVVIGIHGWFPGALIRQVLGEVSSSL